jgi:exodeoxyribonuclease VII large subunit
MQARSKENFPTLSDLLADIKAAVENSFPVPVWFLAEVISMNVHHGSGHCYLELMDKDPTSGKESRSKATIWKTNYQSIARSFEQQTGQRLQPGMRLLMLGVVKFHEYYGFSLNIEDVDATYTLGALALKRNQILEELARFDLIEKNKLIRFPLVPQRIAVISSGQAAGFEDFLHALEQNPYGYRFSVSLFQASMQGKQTATSIQIALAEIAKNVNQFDIVAIMRGGGAQTDLFWFDDFELGKSVANFPLPVLSGLGHKKDLTVVDAVANETLITPTATANFLIDAFLAFESGINQIVETCFQMGNEMLTEHRQLLDNLAYSWDWTLQKYVKQQGEQLDLLQLSIKKQAHFLIEKSDLVLDQWLEWSQWMNPEMQFKRGFALVFNEQGEPVREIPQIGQTLMVRSDKFTVKTEVKSHENR